MLFDFTLASIILTGGIGILSLLIGIVSKKYQIALMVIGIVLISIITFIAVYQYLPSKTVGTISITGIPKNFSVMAGSNKFEGYNPLDLQSEVGVPLKLGVDERGGLEISTLIRDKNGIILAQIENNEWKTFPSSGEIDRNFDASAFEIIDQGQVIFQAFYENGTIFVNGKFYDETGNFIFVSPSRISINSAGDKLADIPKIFEYPSSSFLGKRRFTSLF